MNLKSIMIVTAMVLPVSAFAAGSGTGSSGSAGTTVDTAGLFATGAGENPGISMSFGNAINNAFNGNSGDQPQQEQSGTRKDKDTTDK